MNREHLIKKLSIVTLFVLMVPVSWGQDTVTDIDGNVYETVQIGNQLWMAENLKVTHYNNGDEIPFPPTNDGWCCDEVGKYGFIDYEPQNAEIYGNHYNWFAVDDIRGICPEGWHMPTDEEWTILITHLDEDTDPEGMGIQSYIAGGKMKSTGTIEGGDGLWYSPNTGATNESGFTGLPAGDRIYGNGNFSVSGAYGDFWSSTGVTGIHHSNAYSRYLYYWNPRVYRGMYEKNYGFSVRCVRDETETGSILVPYSTGWNIVGLPLDVEDASYSILFPESIEGTLYSFNGAYDPATNLIVGEGYWLRFNEAGSTTISGTPINELTISLNEGWNLISGISNPLDITEIQDPDGIIISGTVYGFTSGVYTNAENMEPGKGYWIRANSSGFITLIGD